MMSQPRTRSPLYSRNATLPGRAADGFCDERYSSAHSEPWRNQENINKLEGNSHWDIGPSKGEEEVDHWAKFIEAIGHAGRRGTSPTLRYHTQDVVQRSEDRSSHSPRRLPRERLSSPEASHYGAEGSHRRIASPTRRRHDAAHLDRHCSNRNHWDLRGSSPRHLQGKRHDRMEHGYHNKQHEERYHERSSFSERSLKPNYREHHPHPKRFRGLDPEDEYSVSRRGFSPKNAPVIVEHDHGISKHDAISRDAPRSHDPYRNRKHPKNRDPPRSNDPLRNRDHPRSRDPSRITDFAKSQDCQRSHEPPHRRDPPRMSEPPRSRESFKHERVLVQHAGIPHDRYGGSATYHVGAETRFNHSSVGRGNPVRDRSQNREQSRMEPHAREHYGQGTMDKTSEMDLRKDQGNRARAERAWDKGTQPGGNHGVLEKGKGLKGTRQNRTPNTSASTANRMDFTEHETLRIKVDMSCPVGNSSLLGYSSERQLSLDLVNVGRQRLEFLPMLEHSGTYRESVIHSGTFAQEIITLVHHVKESYFHGQGITLNERFSSEQHCSLMDEDEFDENELDDTEPVINRPLGSSSSDTQVICNIGSWQPNKRHAPPPGDLRHDLERRRQQRLQGVKITIAGGSISQMASQRQEPSEPMYVDERDVSGAEDDLGWSEQIPHQSEQWDGPFKETPGSSFSARQNTQAHPRRRRNPNGSNW